MSVTIAEVRRQERLVDAATHDLIQAERLAATIREEIAQHQKHLRRAEAEIAKRKKLVDRERQSLNRAIEKHEKGRTR